MQEKKNLIATVSGGRSSVRVIEHLENSEKYADFNKVYVFNNTGQERHETFKFMQEAEKTWGVEIIKIEGVYHKSFEEGTSYRIVDKWEDLDTESNVFSEMIAYKNLGVFEGLPNIGSPYCSEMLKTRPTKKLGNDIFGQGNFNISIGFRREDMPKRISWAEIKEEKRLIYPLITDFESPVDNFELNKFYEKQPFKLEIHNKFGNCRYCFKKSEDIIVENIRFDIEKGNLETIEWYKKEEKKYGKLFFRKNKSIEELVKLAEQPTVGTLNFDKEEDFKCVCNYKI